MIYQSSYRKKHRDFQS